MVVIRLSTNPKVPTMRANRLLLLLLATLLPGGSATAQVEPLVLHHVTVVDVTDGTLRPDQTVVVQGPRISGIGPSNEMALPPGATVVDAAGLYVIPGLWDMHVHTFNNNVTQPPNAWTFPLYLAHGVTGIRDMWVKPGKSADQVRTWRRELEEGSFVGPRFGDVGTLVDGTPPVQPGADTVVTPGAARTYVGELQAAGIDFVKVYSNLSPEVYDALVTAARDAGLYVAGHGPASLSSFDVAEAGQRSIEHLTGVHETCSSREDSLRSEGVGPYDDPRAIVSTFDQEKCGRLYERFADRETWQVPTLITNRIWSANASSALLLQDEGLVHTPVWEVAEWMWVKDFLANTSSEERKAFNDLYELEQSIVGAMHVAGVPLLAGTDFGNPYIYPGFSLLDELEEFEKAGLSPLAALQTATINPARYLQRTGDLGTVETGKLADLVLLDANPLEGTSNVRRIRAVVANGRLYTRAALDRMKRDLVSSNYREALEMPPPLDTRSVAVSTLQRFQGTYAREGRESTAEVALDEGRIRISFGDWVDQVEPIGGSTFRVAGSNVLYTFLTDSDGGVWGFEVNDGSTVVVYRRVAQ